MKGGTKARATPAGMVDKLELWPVSKLVPYSRNPRRHDAAGVARIAASIRRFGFRSPILVDAKTRTILAGHGRLLAAQDLGLPEVPVVPVEGLSESERAAYVIADNRLTDLSDFDPDELARELELLEDEDLDALGFSDEELADLGVGLEDDATAAAGDEVDDLAELPGLQPEDFGAVSAMTRSSVPMRYWRSKGLIRGEVLDFGCGQETTGAARWDPFTCPDPAPLLRTWDVVLCNYVLNVQPAEHLVTMTVALVALLTKARGGRALFAIRNDLAPGIHRSSRGTQFGRTDPEWRALLAPFFELEPCTSRKFLGYIGRRRKAGR